MYPSVLPSFVTSLSLGLLNVCVPVCCANPLSLPMFYQITVVTVVICCSVNLSIVVNAHHAPVHNSICAIKVSMNVVCHNIIDFSVMNLVSVILHNSTSFGVVCSCLVFIVCD